MRTRRVREALGLLRRVVARAVTGASAEVEAEIAALEEQLEDARFGSLLLPEPGSVVRPSEGADRRPFGRALADGTCACGRQVLAGDIIVEPRRGVWRCLTCTPITVFHTGGIVRSASGPITIGPGETVIPVRRAGGVR